MGLSMICLLFTFIRSTYIYEYLNDGDGLLSKCNKLIWKKNHHLKKAQAAAVVAMLIGIPLILAAVYGVQNNKLLDNCTTYPWYTGSAITTGLYILDLLYVCIIWFKGLKDRIGMRFEIFGRVASSVILIVVAIILRAKFRDFDGVIYTYVLAFSFIWWGTWMPVLFLFQHHRRTRNIKLLGNEYRLQQIDSISRQFFCHENVLFLTRYEEYLLFKDDALIEDMVDDFIKTGSPYQLNITQETRDAVLQDPTSMDVIYEQVVILINDNILPYIKQTEP